MFLVSTCTYCNTKKVTFIIIGAAYANDNNHGVYICAICQKCYEPTIFLIRQIINDKDMLNIDKTYKLNQNNHENIEGDFTVEKIIRSPENILYQCPEHVPDCIKAKFDEAAQCHANDCIIAAGIMLRLCLETVTKNLLETKKDKEEKLHEQIKNLFNQGKIKEDIKDFADEIRLDGNYAVHEGKMNQENLQDLFEFTIALLEDIYTRKKKLELSRERRAKR